LFEEMSMPEIGYSVEIDNTQIRKEVGCFVV